jgi:hypothetical protein
MWAAGAILAELIGRRPIFPGVDSLNQLDLIVSKLGKPSDKFIQSCRKLSCRTHLRELRTVDVYNLYPTATSRTRSLLHQLLEMDPDFRIDAVTAAEHSYFVDVRNELPQPLFVEPNFSRSDFSFEEEISLSVENLRTQLYLEARQYQNEEDSFTTPSPAPFTSETISFDSGDICCMEARGGKSSDKIVQVSNEKDSDVSGSLKKVKKIKALTSLWSGFVDIFSLQKQSLSIKSGRECGNSTLVPHHDLAEETKEQQDFSSFGNVTYSKRSSSSKQNSDQAAGMNR